MGDFMSRLEWSRSGCTSRYARSCSAMAERRGLLAAGAIGRERDASRTSRMLGAGRAFVHGTSRKYPHPTSPQPSPSPICHNNDPLDLRRTGEDLGGGVELAKLQFSCHPARRRGVVNVQQNHTLLTSLVQSSCNLMDSVGAYQRHAMHGGGLAMRPNDQDFAAKLIHADDCRQQSATGRCAPRPKRKSHLGDRANSRDPLDSHQRHRSASSAWTEPGGHGIAMSVRSVGKGAA